MNLSKMDNSLPIETRHYDLLELITGRLSGFGVYRQVYPFLPDPTKVLKVAAENPEQNQIEYAIWREIEYCTGLKQWFAPCVSISPCGIYMIQERVEFGRVQDYPDKIPAWFTDIKTENFGFIGKQLKCVDYAGLRLTINLDKRMKKVTWT